MTKHLFSYLVLLCIAFTFSFPKSLGDKVHVKPLSDKEHFKHHDEEDLDDEHNEDYDHDAFLGKEEANEFDELSPEESKEKLRKIVKRIDTNADGFISEDEMRVWLRNIQNRYSNEDTNKKWKDFELSEGDTLNWDKFVASNYGSEEHESHSELSSEEMMEKNKERWAEVDLDKDGVLTKEEYSYFLHPELNTKTAHVYAKETFDEIDGNKDGKVDLDEFLNDMGSGDDEDSKWVEEEKNNFKNNLDKNKDGSLDLQEVSDWLMQEDLQQVDSETEHLFSQADDNKDKLLSEDEVLEHHETFAGSQATDYGDILHDEF